MNSSKPIPKPIDDTHNDSANDPVNDQASSSSSADHAGYSHFANALTALAASRDYELQWWEIIEGPVNRPPGERVCTLRLGCHDGIRQGQSDTQKSPFEFYLAVMASSPRSSHTTIGPRQPSDRTPITDQDGKLQLMRNSLGLRSDL